MISHRFPLLYTIEVCEYEKWLILKPGSGRVCLMCAECTRGRRIRDMDCSARPFTGSSSSSLLLILEMSETKVYEPQIRALLGTATHFCAVLVFKSRRCRFSRRWVVTALRCRARTGGGEDFRAENSSIQSQNLSVTLLCVPNSLGDARHEQQRPAFHRLRKSGLGCMA